MKVYAARATSRQYIALPPKLTFWLIDASTRVFEVNKAAIKFSFKHESVGNSAWPNSPPDQRSGTHATSDSWLKLGRCLPNSGLAPLSPAILTSLWLADS